MVVSDVYRPGDATQPRGSHVFKMVKLALQQFAFTDVKIKQKKASGKILIFSFLICK